MQQQMMRQQQMNMQRGPILFRGFLLPVKRLKQYLLEFILSPDFTLSDQSDELALCNLDQRKYMEKYKSPKIEEASLGFTSDEIRGIYQEYKTKAVLIEIDLLK